MERIVTPEITLFVNRDTNEYTNSMRQAIVWYNQGFYVETYLRNQYIGLFEYGGTIRTFTDIKPDDDYGKAFYIKDEGCYYINIPDIILTHIDN